MLMLFVQTQSRISGRRLLNVDLRCTNCCKNVLAIFKGDTVGLFAIKVIKGNWSFFGDILTLMDLTARLKLITST